MKKSSTFFLETQIKVQIPLFLLVLLISALLQMALPIVAYFLTVIPSTFILWLMFHD